MGIYDKQLEFSSAQAITVTATSTNIIDLGARKSGGIGSVGENRMVDIGITIDTTFTGGTSLQIQLRSSTASNMASPTVRFASQVYAVAVLTAGARITPIDITGDMDRYCDLNYVVVGTMSTGALTARGGADRHTNF